jgi:hypothetical protein
VIAFLTYERRAPVSAEKSSAALTPVIHEGLNVGHVDLGMGAAGSSVGGHEGFPGDAPVAVSEVSWTVAGGRTSG